MVDGAKKLTLADILKNAAAEAAASDDNAAPAPAPAKAAPAPPAPLTHQEFLIRHSLYHKVDVDDFEFMDKLRGVGVFQFDEYCVQCKMSSTFKSQPKFSKSPDTPKWPFHYGRFEVVITCQRNGHEYRFYLLYLNGLQKIGQYPSIEDIAASDLLKYRKQLGKFYSEMHRANGLFSHGVGIGSFVYLRRVFEQLIEEHRAQLDPVPDLANMRMDQKIAALAKVLPPALVKHKAIYAILSKGIHELDEETCKKHFPVVRAAIIQILEQDWQQREQKRVEAELEQQIGAILGDLA